MLVSLGVSVALLCGTATLPDARAAAQEIPAPQGAVRPAPPEVTISPRGAFLRSLALPGWGHAAIGSHTRGGFYFITQSATAYTLIQARRRLLDVRERIALREGLLRTRLANEGSTDFTEVEAALDGDRDLQALRTLEEARGDQQEDMVAFGIFVLFLSGADAYVSAHLSRFPDPIEVEVAPVGDGRVELGLRVRLPN